MDLHNLESPRYSRGPEKEGNRIALNVWDAGASTQSARWLCRCQALVLVPLELKLSPSKTSNSRGNRDSTHCQRAAQAQGEWSTYLNTMRDLSRRLRHPDKTVRFTRISTSMSISSSTTTCKATIYISNPIATMQRCNYKQVVLS